MPSGKRRMATYRMSRRKGARTKKYDCFVVWQYDSAFRAIMWLIGFCRFVVYILSPSSVCHYFCFFYFIFFHEFRIVKRVLQLPLLRSYVIAAPERSVKKQMKERKYKKKNNRFEVCVCSVLCTSFYDYNKNTFTIAKAKLLKTFFFIYLFPFYCRCFVCRDVLLRKTRSNIDWKKRNRCSGGFDKWWRFQLYKNENKKKSTKNNGLISIWIVDSRSV